MLKTSNAPRETGRSAAGREKITPIMQDGRNGM